MEYKEEILSKYPCFRKTVGIPMEDIVESHDGREVTLLKYIYNHPKLDSELRGSPQAILDAMDEFAAQEDFLINIGSHKAAVLTELLKEHQPKVIVELGGYVGYSAILFGKILRETYPPPSSTTHVYSLELDPLVASIAMNLVSLAGLSSVVEVIVGPSAHTLQRLHDEQILAPNDLDMLFLDHVEELYRDDLALCERLGYLDKSGVLVVADNVVRPGAPEYREYVRGNPRFRKSWGVPGLIVPGDYEDELEISLV
ncbi:hypothetical protein ASPZODRAFT_130837 [Penicilliopsis zonata CBS 506.65]|uniref:catechol O-methyltransferase n=1 Tax=Penicilliopsis zonata CBS 506.65 TaxID=1073090 RepID=A0A1L9SNE3_9EURO|nr:hypothetical protein ASPZODRAFT_130837 [Penicilliopsis zonata CBS 506.65]OJJ48720.1 hypothetical protein ASPZODRAFT_130837 [Penicilliopsis zonata CBS 506.65]